MIYFIWLTFIAPVLLFCLLVVIAAGIYNLIRWINN
jgi:hypothetical protein